MISVSRAALCHIIVRHRGNRTAISKATGHSLNTVRRLITLHGLTGEADDAAAGANRSGPRASVSEEAMAMERDALLAALAEGGIRAARAAFGWSPATAYRKRRQYEITAEEIAAYKSTNPPVK